MKNTLTAILIFTASALFGQVPSLTSANINTIGSTKMYYVADSNATNLDGINGVNVTWDYSSLQGYTTTVDNNLVDATTAANASDFPTSVFADELEGNFMVYENQVADSIFAQGYTFNEPSIGDVLVLLSTDELKIMHYPFTYMDSFNDSLSGTLDVVGGFPLSGDYIGEAVVSADGYGTLLLGTNTYSDILRVKIVESSTANLGLLGTIPLTRTQYNYYQPGTQNFPVFMHTSLDAAGAVQNIVYSQDLLSIIGVNEESQPLSFSVFPNPSTDNLSIELKSATESTAIITISNILGKKLQQKTIQASSASFKANLNVNDLATGVYLVTVNAGSSQATKRIVIK
jgi:hypothetical protein